MRVPPHTMTLAYCPHCGAVNVPQLLPSAHFVKGYRCRGVLEVAEYRVTPVIFSEYGAGY